MIGVDSRIEDVYMRVKTFVDPHVRPVARAATRDTLESPVGGWAFLQVEFGYGEASATLLGFVILEDVDWEGLLGLFVCKAWRFTSSPTANSCSLATSSDDVVWLNGEYAVCI